MAPRYVSKRVPPEVAERLRMAAAAAAEQVAELHVASALETVEEGGDRAPVDRLLETYARLHYLDATQAVRVRERVLAALGREIGVAGEHRVLAAPRSIVGRLTGRVRGRVHHELRDWIDLHTARVELLLVDLHVRHALVFVRLMEGHVTAGAALDAYGRMLGLRSTTAEFVRLRALLTLDPEDSATRVEPRHPAPNHPPLRLADSGG
jgi:hypothetical protein